MTNLKVLINGEEIADIQPTAIAQQYAEKWADGKCGFLSALMSSDKMEVVVIGFQGEEVFRGTYHVKRVVTVEVNNEQN